MSTHDQVQGGSIFGQISHLVGCTKFKAILTFTVLINFGLLRRGHWCWSRFDPSLHQNSGSNFLRIGWGWKIAYFPGLIVHGLNNLKNIRENIKMMSVNQISVYHTLVEAYNSMRYSSYVRANSHKMD